MGNTCFLFLSVLLILLIQCFIVSLAMVVRNLTTDQSSLLHFKDRILDPHNVLAKNWTISSSVCSWIGVSCSVNRKRVTSLNLPNMSLTGTIPPQLGNLSFLISLNLSSNKFYSQLPNELGQLRRLKLVDLSLNDLNGDIPSWLGNLHKVEVLRMNNNSFTGSIPGTLGNMSKLEILILGYNQLSGSIPATIYNMSSLRWMNLISNRFSGSLPTDFCHHLAELQRLSLSENEISGEIPSNLPDCRKLQILSLSVNRFTGLIPRSVGNLTVIKEMYLDENHLEGEIPKEIGNLHTLEVFHAAHLNLSGQIPYSMFNISSLKMVSFYNSSLSGSLPDDLCAHVPNLSGLYLQLNELSGHIPSSIGKCNNLKSLMLTANRFSGSIPRSIGNLTRLEDLFLSANNLEGNIPDTLFNASKLRMLMLEYNSLSGFIPETLGNLRLLEWLTLRVNNFAPEPGSRQWSVFSSLAHLRKLQLLDVSDNPLNVVLPSSIGNLSASLDSFYAHSCQLKGSIPLEVGNLSSLMIFHLSNNELSGFIPPTVGRLQNIQGLFLIKNKLQGSIPQTICGLERLYQLRISFNKLHGPIPACLDNLTSLGYLFLESNKLSFTIPSTLWSLKDVLEIDLSSNYFSNFHLLDIADMKALWYLNLSNNLLLSDISTASGGIKSLTVLDLSNNRLYGHIPESFGDVVSLEFLNLCNNNLSGIIPMSLEKLLYLKYFNVSSNRLEGKIPFGGPFRNLTDKSFMKNYALCGPPRFLVPPCKISVVKEKSKMITSQRVLRYGLPTIVTVAIIIVLTIICKKRQSRSTNPPVKEDLLSLKTWRRISHAELLRATDGFSECNLLGSGSFGSVYRGILSDGMNVAIKVFNLHIEGAFQSFDTECEAMSNILHRNLVKVVTCCSNIDFKALVLDFMSNGSLEKWLHSENCFLDILQRVNIMIDVASALDYLHAGQSTPIIHCDLKPSNILLDGDMVAHVGDFGIAKLLGEGDFMTQTMTLATIGYMAPEFGSAGIVSIKCDVYSYGILLIETFTKKKPTDEIFTEAMTMRYWVKNSLYEGMIDIADANLLRRDDKYFIVKANCISSILELALDCSAELPEERKDMKDVVATLKKIKQRFLSIDQV